MTIPEDTDVLMLEERLTDRRSRRRLEIAKHLSGEILDGNPLPISGVTVNISSKGILFVAQENIPVGARVRLRIDWPALSDHRVELVLLVRVVRSEGNFIAAQVWDHHFQPGPGASA
jgi:hypothetical protein